jgi:hypothetical protein
MLASAMVHAEPMGFVGGVTVFRQRPVVVSHFSPVMQSESAVQPPKQ